MSAFGSETFCLTAIYDSKIHFLSKSFNSSKGIMLRIGDKNREKCHKGEESEKVPNKCHVFFVGPLSDKVNNQKPKQINILLKHLTPYNLLFAFKSII